MSHFFIKFIFGIYVFILFMMLFLFDREAVGQNYILIFIYSFIIIFLIDIGIKMISKEISLSEKIINDYNCIKNKIEGFLNINSLISIIFIIGIIFILGASLINTLLVLSLFSLYYYFKSSKIFFITSLFIITLIPINILLGNNLLVESLSIYVYYSLITGVIFSVFELNSNNSKFKIKVNKIKQNIFDLYQEIKKSPISFLNDLTYMTFVFFVLSLFIESFREYLTTVLIIFVFGYVFLKFLGAYFTINKDKIKISKENINPLLLIVSISFIVGAGFVDMYDFENRNTIYISGVSFFLAIYLFTSTHLKDNIFFIIKNNVYILSSFVFIFSVFGYFYLDNNKNIIENELISDTNLGLNIVDFNELYDESLFDVFNQLEENNLVEEISYKIEMFSENLGVGSEGEYVENLQNFLKSQGYYNYNINGIYDINTNNSMREFLYMECNWSSDNMGILGPQARACIESVLD